MSESFLLLVGLSTAYELPSLTFVSGYRPAATFPCLLPMGSEPDAG